MGAFCRHLGVGSLPTWVTNLSAMGVSARDSSRRLTEACNPCSVGHPCCYQRSEVVLDHATTTSLEDGLVLPPLHPVDMSGFPHVTDVRDKIQVNDSELVL